MKKGLLIFAAIIFAMAFAIYLRQPKEPQYCKYANKVAKSFRHSVKERYHLIPMSYGGSFMGNISEISQTFRAMDKNYSIEQARELVINCSEDFLDRINQDEKIKPYLAQYPFPNNRIRMQISFYNKNRERVSSDNIALVGLGNDKIYYCIYDRESEKLVDIHEEMYEEAVRIVKEGK